MRITIVQGAAKKQLQAACVISNKLKYFMDQRLRNLQFGNNINVTTVQRLGIQVIQGLFVGFAHQQVSNCFNLYYYYFHKSDTFTTRPPLTSPDLHQIQILPQQFALK